MRSSALCSRTRSPANARMTGGDLFRGEVGRHFLGPGGVASHVSADQQAEGERRAPDRLERAGPGTLAACEARLRPNARRAPFDPDGVFAAYLCAAAASGAVGEHARGAKRRDEADVTYLRLRAAVGAGGHGNAQPVVRPDTLWVEAFDVRIPSGVVECVFNGCLDRIDLHQPERAKTLSPAGLDAVGGVIAVCHGGVVCGYRVGHSCHAFVGDGSSDQISRRLPSGSRRKKA